MAQVPVQIMLDTATQLITVRVSSNDGTGDVVLQTFALRNLTQAERNRLPQDTD